MNANETVKALKICGNGKVACCGCPYYIERDGLRAWQALDMAKAALSDTPTDYHNPADVEALEKAREALESIQRAVKPVSNACDDVVYRLADEALAAIDKIGGREDA